MLWAVDSFGTLHQGEVYEAGDVTPDLYDESFTMLNAQNTPWLELVDPVRYAAHVATTSTLPLDLVASAHGPVHRGSQIDAAFERTDRAGQPADPAQPRPGCARLPGLDDAHAGVSARTDKPIPITRDESWDD